MRIPFPAAGTAAVSAFFLLASCAAINPISAAKLSGLSPVEADPAGLSVAIRVPAAWEIVEARAFLAMSWSSRQAAPVREEYRLDVVEGARLAKGPDVMLKPGEKLVLLSLAAADVAPLKALQKKIRTDKAAGRDGKGSLSVGFSGGCWRGIYPSGKQKLSFDIWLQTAPTEDYLPLVQDGDLGQMLSKGGAPTMPSCA